MRYLWQDQLRRFEETGAFPNIFKLKDKLIEEGIKGKEISSVENLDSRRVLRYNHFYETNLYGWPIKIDSMEVGIRTAEYVAKRLDMDVNTVIRNWNGKREWEKMYGGCLAVQIAPIDDARTLTIENQRFITHTYGNFIYRTEKHDELGWKKI